mmetsp:Transcript_31592/g.41854  ORF Transcript_31592/g.41854 Transcript_31592/m.41854 type:complete len:93 (+) Transcript_31592:230-508(+)
MIDKRLQSMPSEHEIQQLVKELAEESKKCVRQLGKDARYKYLIQVIVGQNKGQGVRMGSRQFWDKDTDNFATVTVIKKEIFITVTAFALYLY